ncbi:MerR family transcriptional regulator [Mycobacterium sp. MS1601]|uniref:MerR family transcriptional regulator n=1 Tax=Mycobacterium sp. MS1601 TaxID=1936029 RepID=UPI000979695F|nr:MerR family transcriptional regulator [Mycobacterium sp. MS1601]AQA01612.1 MerR family transcriptional regulator [Mycobacterium sp. MS1601]
MSTKPPSGPVGAILHSLRRAPRRLGRQSREVVENAVSQLFDAVVRAPHGDTAGSGEYRIEELARLANTATRNVRVYRDRGLLHPPLRVGRIALYNDTHLTRLRLITSMLDRGYNLAHVDEMLSAWEQGKDLGAVLGLESAIVGTWAAEKPKTVSRAQARQLVDDDGAFDRLISAGLIRDNGDDVTVVRPALIDAFNEIRGYGITFDRLIDIHEQVLPHICEISRILVQAGAEHVLDKIKPGESLPDETEVAELITMLVRFRTQAVASVTATLAHSIETTIESLVSQLLSEFVEKTPPE